MSEHDLQNEVRIRLSEKGYVVFRVNTGKFLLKNGRWFDVGVPKGFSDLLAIKDGKAFFLEIKALNGIESKEQKNFIKQMIKCGCYAKFVYSLNEISDLLGG